MKEAEKMAKELNFDGITQGVMDYESVGSAKGTAKKKKAVKKSKKKAPEEEDQESVLEIGISDDD